MPKRIVLGITGGIAAYKTAELVRLLTRRGDEVFPVMTQWAARFVGPLTMEALTGNPVRMETPDGGHDSIEHISLIRTADLLLIAPLTANTLAKMANGLADNFLTATYLAHRGKTLVCPAMNTAMLQHPATQRNLARIREDGVLICEGEAGDLACGETGAGRMAEPEVIFDAVAQALGDHERGLVGRRVLVTAGPTCEDLDPVRFISNRSSGKMGFAIARAFRDAGARVTLVHGPVTLSCPYDVTDVPIRTAAEMYQAVTSRQAEADIIVMAAAVADYRPVPSPQKLKKEAFDGALRLERTTDILASLGASRREGQVIAGFAAETESVVENARGKLERKNLDIIFANDVSGDKVFGQSKNHLYAVSGDGVEDLGSQSKEALAKAVVSRIARLV